MKLSSKRIKKVINALYDVDEKQIKDIYVYDQNTFCVTFLNGVCVLIQVNEGMLNTIS